MRKRELELLKKKQFFENLKEENSLNIDYKQFTSIIKGHNYNNIIYSEEPYGNGPLYLIGFIDIKAQDIVGTMYSKYMYKCEDCNSINYDCNKIVNIDTNKLLCQKCSCKYTNRRLDKRLKNSNTIKTRYDNGELEHVREISRVLRIQRNKTIQKNFILNLSNNEKMRIAKQKAATFYNRPKKEQQKINYKRTSAFREYNKHQHQEKTNRLIQLSTEDLIKLREYSYITGDNWDKKRRRTLLRDDLMCQKCGMTNTVLHVHHTIPFVLRCENKELISLCRSCHKKIEIKFNKKYKQSDDVILSQAYSLEGTRMEGLSISYVAEKLNISRQTIYNWIKENKISYIIRGGKKKITIEEFERLDKELNNNGN